jgi:hypothetical protein
MVLLICKGMYKRKPFRYFISICCRWHVDSVMVMFMHMVLSYELQKSASSFKQMNKSLIKFHVFVGKSSPEGYNLLEGH